MMLSTLARDLAVVLWSHGPKVTKIKTTETTETTGTERPRDRETERPREDAISLIRDLTVVTGSQGHKSHKGHKGQKKLFRNNSRDYEIMSYLCVIILCDYEVLRNCW